MYFLLYQSTAALSIYKPPWLSDKTPFWSYTDTDLVEIESRRVVFGLSKPPDQYRFAFVPRNTEVLGLVDSTPTPSTNFPDIPLLRPLYRIFTSPLSTPKLSSSFNRVKGMTALLQSLYASLTLYRTGGGQVNRYGFAAPGLTVLPYAVMSILNLMANLVAPHYPTLYLVRSEVMEEAERRTGLPFHYVVGKVVDESDTNDIVMQGWSEIAGSFKYDDKLLCVSPSAEEDEKIEMRDSSHQTLYVPSCPIFRRTDDFQTSPLRQFIESKFPLRGLRFPQYQYMARRQQALIQPLWRYQQLASAYISVVPGVSDDDLHEKALVGIIFFAELFITLALSKFKRQQSTLAQRAWTVTWLVAGIFGGLISQVWRLETSPMVSRFTVCSHMILLGAPAIGGFVVVFQMLKAYGICYKFV
jgi:hypothetical protein